MKIDSTECPSGSPLPSDSPTPHILEDHLRQPLRDYFLTIDQSVLPARLAELLAQFEAVLAARGEAISFDFRNALMTALPALRTFGLSLSHDVVRADDLVQETCARAVITQGVFFGTRVFRPPSVLGGGVLIRR